MNAAHRLEARAVTLGYDAADIVRDLGVTIPEGRITMIVGANACGKSTLLRGLARLLKPRSGCVVLDGRSNWFEGAQLLAAYLIMAVSFFFL